MQVQPYLFFEGRCEEAAEFYRNAVGAEVIALMRYKDSPEAEDPSHIPPGGEDKVMHMSMRVGDSIVFASDGHCSGEPHFQGVALSLTVDSDADANRVFAALSDGGQVRVPLTQTFFSSNFGMVTDHFGVLWIVYVTPAKWG